MALDMLLKDGELAPTLFAEGTGGIAIISLAEMPDEPDKKKKHLFMQGFQLATSDTIGSLKKAFLVSEAWAGTNKGVVPSVDPRRQEVVVIASVDIVTKAQRVYIFSLKRDRQGVSREILPYSQQQEQFQAENPTLLTFIAGYAYGRKEMK